jgi:hypothetical protein
MYIPALVLVTRTWPLSPPEIVVAMTDAPAHSEPLTVPSTVIDALARVVGRRTPRTERDETRMMDSK